MGMNTIGYDISGATKSGVTKNKQAYLKGDTGNKLDNKSFLDRLLLNSVLPPASCLP